ncbi:hypothetical protein R1CP_36190 (plasmid) [Rhodococcus opacus]|uniref:TerD domain-containing protein n=1 Tax=Rhodococcus opacus TaxID=37919 RepID=A0A1B1KGW8_RHOOP|nr:hypothetical protein R1CP_36190 [Rhodococcus opacus]
MLSKGQNLSLPAEVEQIDVVLAWTESEVEVDASALLLNSGGKVRSDEDFVFYNQPESTDGVDPVPEYERHRGRCAGEDRDRPVRRAGRRAHCGLGRQCGRGQVR